MNKELNENIKTNSEAHETESKFSRKKFMLRLSLGFAGLSAALVSIPVISALLQPLLEKKEEEWRKVGTLADFPLGTTRQVTFINANPTSYAGLSDKSAAWIRRTDENNLIAFAANCSHLGCPVRWEEGAELFMCPCHGGVYYKDGSVAAGPPPKPLTRYQVRIYNNEVQVKTAPMPITNITAAK